MSFEEESINHLPHFDSWLNQLSFDVYQPEKLERPD